MNTPEIQGTLRKFMLKVPEPIQSCTGIRIFGKTIRSFLFSTDVSIIRNTNADAVIAVYPFTPQPVITIAIMAAAELPVFVGVGGGLTQGQRVINLGTHAEFQGAIGVVVNAPTKNEVIRRLAKEIDIPIVVTVVSELEKGPKVIADKQVSPSPRDRILIASLEGYGPGFPYILDEKLTTVLPIMW